MKFKMPLITDGATGTELQRRGFKGNMCTELWVLNHPEAIEDIQRSYLEAGSNIVYAPTFSANRIKLEENGVQDQVAEINKKLVGISRAIADSSDKPLYIAGDLAPTGKFMKPIGPMSFEDMYEVYLEQVRAIEEAGVDLYVVETIMAVPDARAAVLAIKEVSDKPILVSFTCNDKGRTLTGTDVCAALVIFQKLGVDYFGLNCSSGPDMMLKQIQRMSEYAEVPLSAKPNAGLPEVVDGETVYNLKAEEFASYVPAFAEAGVQLFGGCCGTDATHIAAIKAQLEGLEMTEPCSAHKDEMVVATEKNVFILDEDATRSEVITCDEDVAETIDEELEEECDILVIQLEDEEELEYFEECQLSITVPLCIKTDDAELLEKALRMHQGIALYEGSLGEDVLAEMSRKYGMMH